MIVVGLIWHRHIDARSSTVHYVGLFMKKVIINAIIIITAISVLQNGYGRYHYCNCCSNDLTVKETTAMRHLLIWSIAPPLHISLVTTVCCLSFRWWFPLSLLTVDVIGLSLPITFFPFIRMKWNFGSILCRQFTNYIIMQ